MERVQRETPFAVTLGPLQIPPREAIDRLADGEFDVRMVQWSANNPGSRPRDLDRSARRDLLATLRRHSMNLAGIDLWIPMAHFDDPGKSSRALEALLAAIELAENLNRVTISTALPHVPNDDHDTDDDSAMKIALRRHIVETVASEAERRGVPIADHHVDQFTKGAGALADGLQLGPGIDPPAMITAGLNPGEIIISHGMGGRLKSVRISDLTTAGMRGPLGEPDGQLDVVDYRMALAAVEYDRPVVIDARQWHQPWQGIARTIETWNQAQVI